MNRLNMRVNQLERRLNKITTDLLKNNCRSNPCQNGGTCTSMYEGFMCNCPKNWEGNLFFFECKSSKQNKS